MEYIEKENVKSKRLRLKISLEDLAEHFQIGFDDAKRLEKKMVSWLEKLEEIEAEGKGA